MHDSRLPYGLALLVAVAEELYFFAQGELRRIFLSTSETHTRELATVWELPASRNIEEPILPEENEEGPLTFRSTAEVLGEFRRPEKNTVMYTGSENVPVYRQPTVEFDGIIARIPYGAMVMVLEGRGRWSEIVFGNITGFVLRDELMDRAAHVYPDFTIGEENVSDDPNTLKIRAAIEDEFGGGAADVPLQSAEYVLYRLYRKGKRIVWPEVRPRIAGAWHEILRGVPDIHMGIQPKDGAIMEYTQKDGEGHMAYVEAVFPDETISLSEANYPEAGIYNERVLTKEEWRELHPVFIEVG